MPSVRRKASLRVAHSKGCPNGTTKKKGGNGDQNALKSVGKGSGCGCKPRYYTFYRDHAGKVVKGERVLDRRVANRALTKLQAELDAGTIREVQKTTFGAWADEWLRTHQGKETTRLGYKPTLAYAKVAFAHKPVDALTVADVRRFLDVIREMSPLGDKVSDSTLAKHLRGLGACLEAAIPEYATTNPTKGLHTSQRPKAGGNRPAYFTDAEIPRLWAAMEKEWPLYRYIAKIALATGMRQGELIGLRWGDVHLLDGKINVARTYSIQTGAETSPKSGEQREVLLTVDAARVLEEWAGLVGAVDNDALVFRARAGHLNSQYLTKWLYRVMESAGIPRMGERGYKRTWHSFRHTYARLMLEGGKAPLEWVQRQLGHSNINITRERYGEWSREAERRQADALAGVIPV